MCEKDDIVRLKHMLEYTQIALSFASNQTEDTLEQDLQFQFAVLRAIELIGEAASKIDVECRGKYPQVNWRPIIGMRNVLIHVYADIELNQVWRTIEHDLPSLAETLTVILNDINDPSL